MLTLSFYLFVVDKMSDRAERKREVCKAYYVKHKDQCLERSRNYYQANKDKILAKAKERYATSGVKDCEQSSQNQYP